MTEKRQVLIGHSTRFKKGEPRPFGAGKAAGSRDRLSRAFLGHLADSFEKHGKSVLETLRKDDPATYIRVVASLQPKEIAVTAPLSGMDDSKLEEALNALTQALQAKLPQPIQPAEETPAVLN